MKFIEISDGVCVRVDEIESVSVGEDTLTSIVMTHHNTFKSSLPYKTLIELLESINEGSEESPKEMKEALNIMKTMGYFAG
jgi:hypothetical protein